MRETSKSGAQLRAQSGGDPRLAPGELVWLEDDALARNAIRRLIPPELQATICANVAELQRHIHPESTRLPGRPPIRGFVLDWYLDAPGRHGAGSDRAGSDGALPYGPPDGTTTAPAVVKWLRGMYPRTPIAIYTGAFDLSQVGAAAPALQMEPPDPSEHRAGDIVHEALLGHVQIQCELGAVRAPILARQSLTRDLVRAYDRRVFGPSDDSRLAARRWLLAAARHSDDVLELHLRTLEAYFEFVTRDRLAAARGIKESTRIQIEKEINELWGYPMDSLKQRCDQAQHAGGALSVVPAPWLVAEPPATREAPPTRAAASDGRRPSARRKR